MSESAASLRALALECRQLALAASVADVAVSLNEIALDYERQADRAEKAEARTRRLLGRPAAAEREEKRPARRR